VSTHRRPRQQVIIATAKQLGLLGGKARWIEGRIPHSLATAKERSGIVVDTELLQYALAKVALEDDFGPRLLRRKGRIARDVDLEF
jgi:hypothetical protein